MEAKSKYAHFAPTKSANPYRRNLGRNHLNEKAAALLDSLIEKSPSDFLTANLKAVTLTTDPSPNPKAISQ